MKYDKWALRKIGENVGYIQEELNKKTPFFDEERFIKACEDVVRFYLVISERKVSDILDESGNN